MTCKHSNTLKMTVEVAQSIFSLEFPEIGLNQNHKCYHWLSASGIPKLIYLWITHALFILVLGLAVATPSIWIVVRILAITVVSRQVFWRDGTNRDLVQKIETGRDRIWGNAKLNSQLKIAKKSLDNATTAPKIEISVPIFLVFWHLRVLSVI